MRFAKYHALGNDYIVISPSEKPMSSEQVVAICDRHYGLGADGILYGPIESEGSEFGLRIFNPDGSEAEKSGNGLRIFARYLWDQGLTQNEWFSVETLGGQVLCKVDATGETVSVEMGTVSFIGDDSGMNSSGIKESVLSVNGSQFNCYKVSVGNPHCVVLMEAVSEALVREFGPTIESSVESRTNVQFMQRLDRGNIRIEIWERGAGYTLASGSSSTAAAAVAVALGLCDRSVSVHMPGGILEIELDEEFNAMMTGSVSTIAVGNLNIQGLEN